VKEAAMASYANLAVDGGDLNGAMADLVRGLLETGAAEAILVPARQPFGTAVMQTILTDPAEADSVDPLAPVVPFSSATLLARLTRNGAGRKLAAFLRPCEVRAFVELVKLEQASFENVLLIGMECLGRYENRDFLDYVGDGRTATLEFLKAIQNGRGTEVTNGVDIVDTCKACLTPVPENVDLRIQVIGHPVEESFGLESLTPAGDEALSALGLEAAAEPEGREAAVRALEAKRRAFHDALREEYREKVRNVDGLMEIIGNCTDCYNCRVACPVCYCRECVFVTDTFGHESRQYLGWATKRGRLRMPTDTLFYHLTRMAHMSTLCVSCGQCTSACPNDIPVSELFGMVGEDAQAVFSYVSGRDPGEEQPLAHFAENELSEVTCQAK
jgi:formate dehydrogenase subunit beta